MGARVSIYTKPYFDNIFVWRLLDHTQQLYILFSNMSITQNRYLILLLCVDTLFSHIQHYLIVLLCVDTLFSHIQLLNLHATCCKVSLRALLPTSVVRSSATPTPVFVTLGVEGMFLVRKQIFLICSAHTAFRTYVMPGPTCHVTGVSCLMRMKIITVCQTAPS